MTLKHAARHGDSTDHGDPLPEPWDQEQHVFIGGKKAWRTEIDTHNCRVQRHGTERCLLGSLTVLVDGQMAVREGDKIMGDALPNKVTTFAPDVFIGDVPRGLRHPALANEFCADMCKIKKNWANMSPDERKAAVQAAVNKQLKKFGMPEVTISDDLPIGDNLGQFDKDGWEIQLPPGTFDAPAMGNDFTNTVYHEARHAEQWYAAGRWMGGQGTSMTGVDVALATELPLNVGQAAVKQRAAGTSYAGVLGEMMYNSVLGSNRARRDAIHDALRRNNNTYTYARYEGLPEEEDALLTGNLMDSCTCT